MMRNLLKTMLVFVILLMAGCSSGILNTPASTAVIANTPTYISIVAPVLLPYTGKIAFLYSTSDFGYYYRIIVMNADGSDVKDITPPNLPLILGLDLKPDGEHIAFEASIEGNNQIFTMKTDGSDLKQLTYREEGAYSPSWSPDGTYIIFLSTQKDVLDYRGVPAVQGYKIKSDGTGLRRLQDEHKLSVNGLSYRGENLISISVPATPKTTRTYSINSDGIIQKQFSEFTTDGIPVWSRDGQLAVFSTVRPNCSGIIVINTDRSNQNCLIIDNVSQAYRASWSPDGKYIIFSSNLDGDYDLYIVKSDGSDLTQITNMPGDESEPVWSLGQ